MTDTFDMTMIEAAFRHLEERAFQNGRTIEIAVYGDAAILLTFPGRAATREVDAVIGSDQVWLRQEVRDLGHERWWPDDWLNDGVKGWLSEADSTNKSLFRTYPSEDSPGLRVFVASPHYLFAMKCLAMRIGGVEVTQDRSDIERLAKEIGLSTSADALELAGRFYPASRVSPKTRFGLEEIFGPGEGDDVG